MIEDTHSNLSDKCSLMCSLADSSFMQMREQIFHGSVTFKDMEFILKKQDELKRLCAASEACDLEAILKCRELECDSFRKYKTKLESLCSKLLSKVQITGKL